MRRRRHGVRPNGDADMLTSTDLVFDGEAPPYRETDPVQPLTAYARSKAEAEKAVLDVPRSVVVRIGLLFGPSRNGRSSTLGRPIRRPNATIAADDVLVVMSRRGD